jgi:hypothetical protein
MERAKDEMKTVFLGYRKDIDKQEFATVSNFVAVFATLCASLFRVY